MSFGEVMNKKKWIFALLRCYEAYIIVTDVSGQLVGLVFKGQAG